MLAAAVVGLMMALEDQVELVAEVLVVKEPLLRHQHQEPKI
jgi:hypothetical protein